MTRRRAVMLLTVGLALFAGGCVSRPAAADCAYDRAAMFALDQQAFDQDLKGGWRAVANRGCYRQAADLIRDYRKVHPEQPKILYWHEGQMRANAGQVRRSIPLFEQAKDAGVASPWNLYADATIAYLRRDRAAFDRAREALYAIPEPPFFARQAEEVERQLGFRPTWPQNHETVDRLAACFDQPYEEAYACPRSAPRP